DPVWIRPAVDSAQLLILLSWILLSPPMGTRSLELDGGAGALEGLLGLLRRSLVDLLKDGLGCTVNEVLGLLQAEGGQRTDLLDDLDLLLAGGGQNDVELVLLLLGSSVATAGGGGSGTGNGNGGRSGDVEG